MQTALPQRGDGVSVFERWRSKNSALLGIGLISCAINLLALTSPIFMLQVYDRVLSSGSLPTLYGLAVLAIGLYAFQALLDILRGRILLRIGEYFDQQLSPRIHRAILRIPLISHEPVNGIQPFRDLDNVRGFIAGSGPAALLDLPWIPVYLGICFLFHFWIGVIALIGAVVLVMLTVLANLMSRKAVGEIILHGVVRNNLLEEGRRNAELVQALGLWERLQQRWEISNAAYFAATRQAADVTSGLGGLSKALRVALQSTILGVGAILVITHQTTGGVMIASSVIVGRALAPIDMAIANWGPYLTARQSWSRIKMLLQKIPQHSSKLDLPVPQKMLCATGVAIRPPGLIRPTVAGISFRLHAGSALGVIGPTGAGKSTLARVLVGVWPPAAGKIRLDGASLDQWDVERLGSHIGYLPQGVDLFDGTIAENISRLSEYPNHEDIVLAAKAADAHELILRFEDGYQTRVGELGSVLSAGHRQRIGLARALYCDPFLVVLDEPNANLDADGEAAVIRAVKGIRERGGIAVVVAHRPSAVEAVDQILILDEGKQKFFGPREEIHARLFNRDFNAGNVPLRSGNPAPSYSFEYGANKVEGAGIRTPLDDVADEK